MIVPSVSSVTVIWLVVPAIQSARLETDERTLEPLEKTRREAVKMSLVMLPETLRPLVMFREPEKDDEPVFEKVLVP